MTVCRLTKSMINENDQSYPWLLWVAKRNITFNAVHFCVIDKNRLSLDDIFISFWCKWKKTKSSNLYEQPCVHPIYLFLRKMLLMELTL